MDDERPNRGDRDNDRRRNTDGRSERPNARNDRGGSAREPRRDGSPSSSYRGGSAGGTGGRGNGGRGYSGAGRSGSRDGERGYAPRDGDGPRGNRDRAPQRGGRDGAPTGGTRDGERRYPPRDGDARRGGRDGAKSYGASRGSTDGRSYGARNASTSGRSDGARRQDSGDGARGASRGYNKPDGNSRYGKPEGGSRYGKSAGGDREGRPTGDRRYGNSSSSSRYGKPDGERRSNNAGGERRYGSSGGSSAYGARSGGPGARSHSDNRGGRETGRGYGSRDDSQRPEPWQNPNRPSENLPVRARHDDPVVPDDVEPKDLDKAARVELKTLTKENSDWVARHLAMAGILIDTDPELAHRHAISASRKGGRVGIVRETVGLTAYAVGDFSLALRELRTFRRITGSNDQLPVMVDCERGLGRPKEALELGRSVDRTALSPDIQVELAIAMSGARLDLGQEEEALVELEIPQLDPNTAYPYSPRLYRAYAEVLDGLGREDEANGWIARAEVAEEAFGIDADGFPLDEDNDVEVVELVDEELDDDADGTDNADDADTAGDADEDSVSETAHGDGGAGEDVASEDPAVDEPPVAQASGSDASTDAKE